MGINRGWVGLGRVTDATKGTVKAVQGCYGGMLVHREQLGTFAQSFEDERSIPHGQSPLFPVGVWCSQGGGIPAPGIQPPHVILKKKGVRLVNP